MIRDFDKLMEQVKFLHHQLMQMVPVTLDNRGECDYPGVYLFTEHDKHLYVGRTRRIRRRLSQHSHLKILDAPFAFRLARESTGNLKATYQKKGSRKELLACPIFLKSLAEHKNRISEMAIRYVRVDDDVTQMLLEVYTATVLGAPYNDFKTT